MGIMRAVNTRKAPFWAAEKSQCQLVNGYIQCYSSFMSKPLNAEAEHQHHGCIDEVEPEFPYPKEKHKKEVSHKAPTPGHIMIVKRSKNIRETLNPYCFLRQGHADSMSFPNEGVYIVISWKWITEMIQ